MIQFDAFTSDLHFGHKKILQFCPRPFSSVEEMTEGLIKRYNDKISHKDRVLFVGDIFFLKNKQSREILSQMNGIKTLVIGNHDASPHSMISRGFNFVADKLYFKWENRKIVVCHYDYWEMRNPFDDRYKERRHPLTLDDMEILIHGHTHQPTKTLLNQIHIGVDSWDQAPARYEEIQGFIKNMPDAWSRRMREELSVIQDYKTSLISKNLDEQQKSRYDHLRILGWEKETKKREM